MPDPSWLASSFDPGLSACLAAAEQRGRIVSTQIRMPVFTRNPSQKNVVKNRRVAVPQVASAPSANRKIAYDVHAFFLHRDPGRGRSGQLAADGTAAPVGRCSTWHSWRNSGRRWRWPRLTRKWLFAGSHRRRPCHGRSSWSSSFTGIRSPSSEVAKSDPATVTERCVHLKRLRDTSFGRFRVETS